MDDKQRWLVIEDRRGEPMREGDCTKAHIAETFGDESAARDSATARAKRGAKVYVAQVVARYELDVVAKPLLDAVR